MLHVLRFVVPLASSLNSNCLPHGRLGATVKNTLSASAVAIVYLAALCAFAQDTTITGNPRVDKLLAQMTLDEQIAMIHGTGEDASTYQGQAGYLPGIKRLGIPPMRFADGPPGDKGPLARQQLPSSAVFPRS